MPMGTAEKHLRKDIIHELASQLGKDLCCRCNLKIESPDDLAIVHVQDWEENSDLFWDLTNIAFSHAACEADRSGKRQREKKPMSKVDVRVEDPNGNPLAGTRHEGNLYVAGKKNSRYHIRVRNKTNRRVLVVTTVDGRSVHTGEPGGDEDSGHVLGPRESWVFKGWRTSDNEVAAFRFSKKGNSYSSQLGSAENVGVIGVAVFEEEEPEPIVRTVREFIPYPVPTVPFIQPVQPWQPNIFYTTENTGGSVTFTSTSDVNISEGIASVNCSTSMGGGRIGSSASQFSITSDSAPVAKQARGRKRSRKQGHVDVNKQDLGTEFGEQVHSSVVSVEFERATDAPCEVWTIYYDSLHALKQKGIMVGRPSQKPQSPPQAFPEQPGWEDGYCKPPPRRRAYKP
jgi:hypothetical protein